MISVGSRDDGRKGFNLSYGVEVENMDLETELEEGEACFQNNLDDDDSTIDPDVALSYLDEKLQDVLGHFQKDFEGGVSAENLGAKFGGYGSFLPTYQRSPICPHPKTPPKLLPNNASNDLHVEGGRQNSVSVNASQPRHGPASTSGAPMPAPRGSSLNTKAKHEVHASSGRAGEKITSNGQQPVNNFANSSDPKSLKVRIKVGSDNLSTRKKAEIYSGLGLDVSPSSSLEASPPDSDDFCHMPHDNPHNESPTSILEMMTSFPVVGGLLLSPLPDDLLCLTEKVKFEDNKEITFMANKSDSKVDQNVFFDKKPKIEGSFVSVEPSNNVLDFRKGAASKGGPVVIPKEESLDPVLTHDDFWPEKPKRKDGTFGNANSDEKHSSLLIKSDSDVSKSGKVLETGLMKKAAQKATSREKDSVKLSTSSSGGKKKSKGSQILENGLEASNVGLKNELSSKSRKNTNKAFKVDDPKNNQGKVRDTYKDFFGEDPELEDVDDMALEEKPKDYRVNDKSTSENKGISKDRINGKKGPKPSLVAYPGAGLALGPGSGPHIESTMGNGPVSDAASATVAAVVNEDWVCCDKCEKWRLLPPGINPGSLPEKWLCSMLDWLPGMNRCSISQEETTKAITTHFPCPAPSIQGVQTGVMSVDLLHPDQRQQPFGPPSSVKKKHVTKDLPNELKQERPSLSSNSTKKNLQTSNKTRSLNDANQSPLANEVEFQDSGQSSSLIPETQRLKHKDKKKQHEKFVDEGNNALQLKIKNKRETSQDYSRDSKKVKTEDNHRMDKNRTYDHDGAVFKSVNSSVNDLPSRKDHWKYDDRPKDTSKVVGLNPKNQNENGTYRMGNFEERNVAKKRKSSNEFEDSQIEETSENGHRKGKKAKEHESREEETVASKGRQIESSRKDMAVPALLAATSSSSKVSGSHKTKTEPKGSPVESVSSSPLRILNSDKLTSSRRNVERVEACQDAISPNNGKAEIIPPPEFPTFRVDEERRNDDQSHSNGSRSRKNGKGSSSRSKDKNRGSKSDIVKVNLKISERTNETNDEEKSKGGRNKSQERPFINSEKLDKMSASKKDSSGKPSSENAKRDAQSIQDVKPYVPTERERDGERSSKRDTSGRGKPHSLPPSGKGQNETSRSQKENVGNALLVEGVEGSDASKQKKKSENQNGNQSASVRHPTPIRHKGRDHDAPSPLRRELSSQAATAIKEAKTLKHMADRLKNSGSNHESNSLYFQAALKFLHGASLLESNYNESGKHGDTIQSMGMYSSTAKLCEYVAHEYEKSKEMAAAALAYKLAEVAYLKVVYSSHANASKDRLELQTSLLQIGPTGESPSSSASDIDNLNNPAAIDKTALAKGVNDPQIGGNHVIAARNKPNFLRILNFAQDVNLAMEASRRSQIAFAASGSQPEHAHHQEVIKPALDFNFQDVEGLLQLVRVAMEVISR